MITLLCTAEGMAQGTACDCAERWQGGGHWNTNGTINDLPNAPMANGIIRCASSAETQSQVVPNGSSCTWNVVAAEASGIQVPFGEVCFDPSDGPDGSLIALTPPTDGQPIIWLNFDVRAYVSSFSFQINDNSGDVLGWALYESTVTTSSVSWNAASGDSLSGDCSALQLVDFGDGDLRRWCGSESSSTWSTPGAEDSFNALVPTNFFLLIWDQSADGDLSVNNFKARFGCSDPTICFLEVEDAIIDCDVTAGTYTVTVPIIGNNGQYVGTDPNATPTTSAAVCLTNLGSTGVVTGNIVMTYPIGIAYDIDIAPVVPATGGCATPDNAVQCTANVSGIAPSADLTVSHTDVSCFGETDGTITASAPGGVAITVDGAVYDATATYGAGSYLVCAAGTGACADCETVMIGGPAEVELMVSSTNVTCFGEDDGTISPSSSMGTSITVDGVAFDPSMTYGPGTYEVCASAPGGNEGQVCEVCETVEIEEPAEVVLTASGTDVSCFGEEDGMISASAGTASITVDGVAYDATATYGPGSYLVCASAPGGNPGQTCTDCETIVVGEAGEVELMVSSTDVSCFGEADGTITASASVGASITVDGVAYDATATYGAGTYTVCASAAGGTQG
ncbi:MAG: hypothetical protein M3R08_09970, partial [Bacteroidota bacterium]|nr:hypothetical protein [Bacteroidota bacterium]